MNLPFFEDLSDIRLVTSKSKDKVNYRIEAVGPNLEGLGNEPALYFFFDDYFEVFIELEETTLDSSIMIYKKYTFRSQKQIDDYNEKVYFKLSKYVKEVINA